MEEFKLPSDYVPRIACLSCENQRPSAGRSVLTTSSVGTWMEPPRVLFYRYRAPDVQRNAVTLTLPLVPAHGSYYCVSDQDSRRT